LLAPAFANADCVSPGFNPSGMFCNGCTYEGAMMLNRDQPCERPYMPAGPNPMQVLGNRVVQRAKHGIAGANGNTFAYAPSRGYVGSDEFIVEVSYRQGTEQGKFRVHWSITVQ
jgi:hypothetical protein